MKTAKPRKMSEAVKDLEATREKTALEKAKAQFEFEKQCINTVAGSTEGRVVFRVLARLCCHNRSKVGMDAVSKVVDLNSTAHNAAQELIYLNFRKLIRREYLIKIEFPNQTEDK